MAIMTIIQVNSSRARGVCYYSRYNGGSARRYHPKSSLSNKENGLTGGQRNDRMNRKSKILVWSTIDRLRTDFEIIE